MNLTILDNVLNNFEGIFINGLGNIHGMAFGLLWKLIIIDLALAILLNLEDGNHMQTLVSKILKYGIWIAIVTNYGEGINILIQGFTNVGLAAGGGLIDESVIKHPSAIMEASFKITNPLMDWMRQFTGITDIVANAVPMILTLVSVLLVILAFGIIAINVFITYLEFYIVATLSLIFMPFGANKYTNFIAEKAMGALISFGVKFMVLGLILSASIPQINKISISVNQAPDLETLVACVSVCMCIAFLAWHAPSTAAGLMAGSPSLSAEHIVSPIRSAASSATAATSAAVNGGASSASSNNSSVSKAAGAISQRSIDR